MSAAGLRIAVCASCGRAAWPAPLLCARCGGGRFEAVVSRRGTLEQATDLAGPGGERLRLGSVRLEQGPLVVARCEELEVGAPVAMSEVDGVVWAGRKEDE